MKIQFKKLHSDAKTPVKAKSGDMCYDLFSCEDVHVIRRYNNITTTESYYSTWALPVKISTGIAIGLPDGFGAKIEGRSGLASKGIFPIGGVIDSDYCGEIKVILVSLSGTFNINKGDRIAQLKIEKIHNFEWEEVDELLQTERGEAGFGSTGI